MMKTDSEYIRLVDYVADLRSKLQRGTQRLRVMRSWLSLLNDAKRDPIESELWKDAMRDQELYLTKLNEQLHEYEVVIGWR